MSRATLLSRAVLVLLLLLPAEARGQAWLEWQLVTGSNLVAAPNLGFADVEEKDYVSHDFDKDGDPDVVCVRKLPFTSLGDRQNVYFENVFGVLTDRTAALCPSFITHFDNSRDVMMGDFDNDTWMDFVVANAGNENSIGQQPRIFMNLGMMAGIFQGFAEEPARMPFLQSPGGLQPNSCAVGVGDVTGNGAPDIYLVDYVNNLEDKLLVNNGFGFFSDETDLRLPAGFKISAFATAGMIVDVNADGYLDIVKNTTPDIKIAYNNGGGFYTTQQSLNVSSAYHFDVGDLNNDGKNDIYVVEDSQDKYLLNLAQPGSTPASWTTNTPAPSPLTTGFGGNVYIVDLDADGAKDVVVTDVDTDVPGCTRRIAYLRSDGSQPFPAIADPYTSLEAIHQSGVFDVCIDDFNGDGAVDLLVGHCSGTDLYFQVPPAPPIVPVEDLACAQSTLDVTLAWSNPQTYASIAVRRNGVTVATLAGTDVGYIDVNPGAGSYSYTLIASDGTLDAPPVSCVVEVSTVHVPSPLHCVQVAADVQLSWSNHGGVSGAPYDQVEIERNGVQIAAVPGVAQSYLDSLPPLGSTQYVLRGVIGVDRSAAATCSINVAATNATDLVLDFVADDGGATDSATALAEALAANGRVVHHLLLVSVTDLPGLGVNPNDYARIWVELGTSPHNKVLSVNEGQVLASFVTDGVGGKDLFVSGADTFFFDPTTPLHLLMELTATDGFGTIANVEGVAGTTCTLTELPLTQFSGEDTAVDRLVATGTGENILLANSGLFAVGVFTPQPGGGAIICQSVETGGLATAHAQKELVRLYLHCMPSGFPPPTASFTTDVDLGLAPLSVTFTSAATGFVDSHAWEFGDGAVSELDAPTHTYASPGSYTVTYTVSGPGGSDVLSVPDLINVIDPAGATLFVRGDANSDSTINVADAVRMLTYLFPAGTPIAVDCLSALDANDDGSIDVADPVRTLSYLFGGASVLAAPYPACGVEGTPDALSCSASSCP